MDWQTFFRNQLASWPETDARYNALDRIKTRFIRLDDNLIRVDYNPARERSTAARTDKESISRRACFLCADARPTAQLTAASDVTGLEGYDFLVNPFPILNPHFTIVSTDHRPQDVPDNAMLTAARRMPGLTFFYNGAKAGASAPDHAHFQAVKSFRVAPPVRCEIFPDAEVDWQQILVRCREAGGLFNLFVYSRGDRVEACFIPRKAHRPKCYPDIMVSPGALDVAGHIITVREADFRQLNTSILREIYADTCFF